MTLFPTQRGLNIQLFLLACRCHKENLKINYYKPKHSLLLVGLEINTLYHNYRYSHLVTSVYS